MHMYMLMFSSRRCKLRKGTRTDAPYLDLSRTKPFRQGGWMLGPIADSDEGLDIRRIESDVGRFLQGFDRSRADKCTVLAGPKMGGLLRWTDY